MTSNCDCNRSISSRHFVGKLALSNFVVFSVIMTGTPVGLPVPQMQKGINDLEALDCSVLDYSDHCTVMGCFVLKAGCKYEIWWRCECSSQVNSIRVVYFKLKESQ